MEQLKQIFAPRDLVAERQERGERVAAHMVEWEREHREEQARERAVALLEKRGLPVPEYYIGKRRNEASGVILCMPTTEAMRVRWRRQKRQQRARQRAQGLRGW